jgi:arylsulfatase A-like enzyme
MPDLPSFVILYPDSLGANAVGAYGCTAAQTPHLDALAAGGLRFDACTAQNPLCMPSRTSLHTGTYVATHGFYDNGVMAGAVDRPSLVRSLRTAGYRTIYLGKTHAIDAREWDEVFDLYAGYNHYLQARGLPVRYPERFALDRLNAGFSRIPLADFSETVLGNLAMDVIRRQAGDKRPFLLFVSFEAPHSPWSLPEEARWRYRPEAIRIPACPACDRERRPAWRQDYFDKRAAMAGADDALRHCLAIYHALAGVVDEQLGRIVAALDAGGLRDRTVVAACADHGDHCGNHRSMGKCLSLDESLVRIPLILNAPGRIAPGSTPSLVEAIDLYPTLLDLAGVEIPAGVQGRSLRPLIDGERGAPFRSHAFSEEHARPYPGLRSVRDERWKLVLAADGHRELFDLAEDPLEWRNRAGKAPTQAVEESLVEQLALHAFRTIDQRQTAASNWVEEFMRPGFHRY